MPKEQSEIFPPYFHLLSLHVLKWDNNSLSWYSQSKESKDPWWLNAVSDPELDPELEREKHL